MSWENVTITKGGEQLLSKMMNGSKLLFTRVVIGDKTVNNELLSAQTSVFSPLSAPALIAGRSETPQENGTQIKIQIRNDGVSKTTRMLQIGLYAKSEHDEEVLFGILQDDIGEEIPAYEEFPQFLIELYATIAISRTNNIQVVVNPSVYITFADLQKFKDEIDPSLMPKDIPEKVDDATEKAELALETANKVKQQLENLSVPGITKQEIIIPTTGWVQGNPEEYEGLLVDIPVEGVTEDMIPIVIVPPKQLKVIGERKFSPCVKSDDGYIRLYSKASPPEPINATLILLITSEGATGGGNYQLPTASEDRLGGVKIGENITVSDDGTISVNKESLIGDLTATNEETQAIIDKHFAINSNPAVKI